MLFHYEIFTSAKIETICTHNSEAQKCFNMQNSDKFLYGFMGQNSGPDIANLQGNNFAFVRCTTLAGQCFGRLHAK